MAKRAGKHKNRRRGKGHQKRRSQLRRFRLLSHDDLKLVFQEVTSPDKLLQGSELSFDSPGTPVLDEPRPGVECEHVPLDNTCRNVREWLSLELAIQPLPNLQIDQKGEISNTGASEEIGDTENVPELSENGVIVLEGVQNKEVLKTPEREDDDMDVLCLDSPGMQLFMEKSCDLISFKSPYPITPGRDLELRARLALSPISPNMFSPVPEFLSPISGIDCNDNPVPLPLPSTPGRWIDILNQINDEMSENK